MAIAVEFDVDGIRYLSLGLNAIARNVSDTRGLLSAMGAEVESQTKDRIEDKKRAPNGRPWAPWSPGYAATRHGNHSLLINEGHLQNSIAWQLAGDTVRIGSPLEYAATHQFGAPERNLPARPFLDVALEDSDDRQQLEDILGRWVQRQIDRGTP